jgi:YfiH family protein
VAVVTEAADRGWNTLDRTFEADALVTDLPGVVLTILTADCVPVLLYDPIRRAVGAVHAGWRGTHARIVPKTVETMQKRYGTDPRDLIVGIGPAIGGCCYEVGPEVAERFVAYPDALLPQTGGKYRLDTKEINRIQLIEIGVPETHIEVSPICTMCEHDRYFSYRADATAGRFMSGIMLVD